MVSAIYKLLLFALTSYVAKGLAECPRPTLVSNINHFVDYELIKLNALRRAEGRSSVEVDSVQLTPEVFLDDITVHGLDTFYRTGNCTVSLLNDYIEIYDLTVGIRELAVTADDIITDRGVNGSGLFIVQENSIRLQFEIYRLENGGCLAEIFKHALEYVDGVDFIPSYDFNLHTDIVSIFKKVTVDKGSVYLKQNRQSITRFLEEEVCSQQLIRFV